MSKYSTLVKRVSNATAATALTLASLTPAVMLGGSAKAAQIMSRSIEMSTSAPDTSADWVVTVDDLYSGDAFTIEVCTSPLFDVTCANPEDGSTGSSTDDYSGTFGTTVTNGTVKATVSAFNPSGVDGNNTPGDVGTFYVRITSGSDEGAVAMSTTNDLTINARVQEQLTFCVGADTLANIGADSTGIQNCSAWTTGATQLVDLGVVSDISVSPVAIAQGSPEGLGNNKTGFFMLQTNAANGARVAYEAASELMVPGASCGTPSNAADQCFNNATNMASFTTGQEKFGMTISDIYWTGNSENATISLIAEGDYDTNYTWNTGAGLHTIASASKAVDWDKAVVDFGAATASGTPSGSYSTSANFVATGLF